MKKRNLGIISVAAALVMGTTGLAACGPTADPENTIVVSILNQTSEKTMFEAVADAFEKSNPGTTVTLLPLSNYETDVRQKIKTGERIDVMHVPDSYVTSFAIDDVLENLEPYITSSGFDRSLYYGSMMDMGRLNYDSTKDQYMIPRDYSKFVVYYNKDLFTQYGVAFPESGWTWSDFKETCRQLKQKLPEGYVCVDASMSYDILNYGMLASCGVEKLINDEFELISDTSKVEEGMTMIKQDMIDSGYSRKPELYKDGDFIRSVAAMSINVRPAFTTYKNAELDFDVVEFPAIGENPKIATGSSGFGIYTQSTVKDLGWKFISFMASEEGQTIMNQQGGVVPVLKSLAEKEDADWKKLTNGKGNAVNHTPFFSYQERDVVDRKWGDLPPEARSLYSGYWGKFMNDYLNGKTDMASALNTMKMSIRTCKRQYPEYFE